MALVVGNATVATGMSPIVEAGLYADAIFIDGISFSSKHDIGSAGQIQVEKYQGGRGVAPGTPGADFNDRDYSNTVIDININNSFKDSAKVPAYYEATMPVGIKMNKVLEVTQRVGTGRQESALAAICDQGTVSANTSVVTENNIKNIAIAMRTELRKKHAKPNVCIASIDTYAAVLKAAGQDFAPWFNEDAVRSGKVGFWLGVLWIEADLLDGNTKNYKYITADGTTKTVDTSDVDLIMYDANAFSIIDRLDLLRVKDSEQFAGSKVQEEVCTGFRVTNEDCVLIKEHQTADPTH